MPRWGNIGYMVVGFFVGVCCGAAGAYFAIHTAPASDIDTSILFPMKVFSDGGPKGDFVNVEGTLMGEGVGYKNNTVEVICYRSDLRCMTIWVDQIGPQAIGSIGPPLELTVTNWTDALITASGPTEGTCTHLTVNIDRRGETVEWVQEPVNQSQLFCQSADTKTYKWSIENPPFWQRMKDGARP